MGTETNIRTTDGLPKTDEGKRRKERGMKGKYERDTIVEPYRVSKGKWV